MNTFWRGLLANAGWKLVLGVVLTVVAALPHKPNAHDALTYCVVSLAVSVIGNPIAKRLINPKGPPA